MCFRFICIFCIFLMFSCTRQQAPKKKGYLRIDLPTSEYVLYDENALPFTFLKEKNSELTYKDNNFYLPILKFPSLNAELYLTYHALENQKDLEDWQEFSRKLVYEHTQQATAIDEKILNMPQKNGVFYHLKGNVASNFQFYLSDQKKHFLRGAFYFSNTPNADSLAPFIHRASEELQKFLDELAWKSK